MQTGIQLQVNTAPEIPITLGVGQVTEQVQVEANVSQVETRAVGVGIRGRDPDELSICRSMAAIRRS